MAGREADTIHGRAGFTPLPTSRRRAWQRCCCLVHLLMLAAVLCPPPAHRFKCAKAIGLLSRWGELLGCTMQRRYTAAQHGKSGYCKRLLDQLMLQVPGAGGSALHMHCVANGGWQFAGYHGCLCSWAAAGCHARPAPGPQPKQRLHLFCNCSPTQMWTVARSLACSCDACLGGSPWES